MAMLRNKSWKQLNIFFPQQFNPSILKDKLQERPVKTLTPKWQTLWHLMQHFISQNPCAVLPLPQSLSWLQNYYCSYRELNPALICQTPNLRDWNKLSYVRINHQDGKRFLGHLCPYSLQIQISTVTRTQLFTFWQKLVNAMTHTQTHLKKLPYLWSVRNIPMDGQTNVRDFHRNRDTLQRYRAQSGTQCYAFCLAAFSWPVCTRISVYCPWRGWELCRSTFPGSGLSSTFVPSDKLLSHKVLKGILYENLRCFDILFKGIASVWINGFQRQRDSQYSYQFLLSNINLKNGSTLQQRCP